ncbi:MAG: translocation/assembly module TamB domain-containing protein, partial [bacterium]
SISAKVIYDGSILSFRDIKGKTGSSSYSGYTELDFDKVPGPTIKGHGVVSDAYSGDIYKLLKKEDRIPGAPSGLVNAVIKFEGYPTWQTIKLDSKLKIRNVEFFSERFDELVANFVWDKGELALNDLYLTKGKGRLDFKGTRKSGNLKMDVNSKNLSLSDFAVLSKRNIDLSGGVNIKGNIEQAQKRLSGDIKFDISELVMGGQKLKPVNMDLVLGQQISLKFNMFEQEAKGEIFKESEDVYVFKSKFTKFNFYPVGSLLLKDIENFKTDINGELEVRFNKNLAIKSAKIRIDSFSLINNFVSVKNNSPIYVDYLNGVYGIKPFSIMTDSDNNKCVLNFDKMPNNDITVKGCITTGLLKIFKGGITGARGKFDVDMIYGTKLKGLIIPKDVEIMTTEQKLGSVLLNGKINVDNNFAKLEALVASIGGANVTFTGGLDLDSLIKLKSIYPVAKVGLHADKLYFQYPEGLNGKWSGDINITGAGLPYDLTGLFYLFEASYRKDFNLNMLGTGRNKKSKISYLSKKEKNKFNLDVKVKSGDYLIVKNNIFDGDLNFDLNIKGTEIDPKIIGSIDLNRGKVTYLDNVFDLTAGRFKFKEDTEEPVVYQLESEAKIGDYQVYLHLVSNRGEPKFKLTSMPPLTEDKIMALMATGDVQTDFSEKSGYGMSTGAGGQLVTEGLGVTNALKEKTGVGFRVKAPTTQGSTLPDIELQKYLTNDIKVIYGKSLGDTTNKQQVNVQYEVNRNVQLKLLLQEEVKNANVSQDPTNAGVDVNFKFEF